MEQETRQLVKLVKEICAEHGIAFRSFSQEWILELEAGSRRMLIYGYKFPNNNAAAEQVCNDKAGLSDLLEAHGIPHVPHHMFSSPLLMSPDCLPPEGNWEAMHALLRQYGKAVLKPNTGTGGKGVYRVSTPKELELTAHAILSGSPSMAVAPYRKIRAEYRVILVDFQVAVIYGKKRPAVTGNGADSLASLIHRDPRFAGVEIDGELDTRRVPADGEIVEISWKHNLEQGARPELVTDPQIRDALTQLALSCAEVLDARFISVDIVDDEFGLEVLEINSGVMMENLSVSSPQSRLAARGIYEKAILSYLGHPDRPKAGA